MKYVKTDIEGVYVITPKVFEDSRGYFFEAFKSEEFKNNIGDVNFIQDNESKSGRGVLRGLHYQKGEYSQAKLVRVIKGCVLDVAVDLRKSSPTFGRHVMVELSDENKNNDLQYSLIASKYIESAEWNNASYGSSWLSYNANRRYTNSDVDLYTLAYCFLADNGNADDYTLPAEALVGNKSEGVKGWFEEYSATYGGDLVNDRFSSSLFSEVAEAFTDVTITADDTFKLTDEQISQNWWQQFVGGGYNVTGTTEYLISAIKQVDADDFESTAYETCEGLYIDESDYDEFKAFYDEATENDETVYLFRYAQTEYVNHEVAVYSKGDDGAIIKGFGYDYVNTNAYFAEMWVQLDFDIIDVTMTKNGVDTIIPVVMSPVDLAADATPPVITNEDGAAWWAYVIIILAEILGLLLLSLLLCNICKLHGLIMLIPVAVVVVLDIFFIQSWALSLTRLLEPYLGWLPFS